MNESELKRNYGIDLLKCIAIFMVVVHHNLTHGQMIDGAVSVRTNYYIANLLESIVYSGVDIFVLVTGFLLCNHKFHISSLLERWLQAVFYCLVITLGVWFLKPDAVSSASWHMIFTPVMSNTYWFFTQYFGLCFLIPVLQAAVEFMNRKMHFFVVFTSFLFFSLISVFLPSDLFSLSFGYSLIWMICLFMTGAYLKKYPFEFKKEWHLVLLMFVCDLCTCIIRIHTVNGEWNTYLFSYNSPSVLIKSICMVLLFSKMNIKNYKLQKFLSELSSLTLGIYLIDDHPFVRSCLISGRFMYLGRMNPFAMLFSILGVSLLIFFAAAGIDLVRKKLFGLLKIKRLSGRISAAADSLFERAGME